MQHLQHFQMGFTPQWIISKLHTKKSAEAFAFFHLSFFFFFSDFHAWLTDLFSCLHVQRHIFIEEFITILPVIVRQRVQFPEPTLAGIWEPQPLFCHHFHGWNFERWSCSLFLSDIEGKQIWRVKQLWGVMTEEGVSKPWTLTTAETTKIQNIWLSSAGTCALRYCVFPVFWRSRAFCCVFVCVRIWFTVVK